MSNSSRSLSLAFSGRIDDLQRDEFAQTLADDFVEVRPCPGW
jgi:hypothetical protein